MAGVNVDVVLGVTYASMTYIVYPFSNTRSPNCDLNTVVNDVHCSSWWATNSVLGLKFANQNEHFGTLPWYLSKVKHKWSFLHLCALKVKKMFYILLPDIP